MEFVDLSGMIEDGQPVYPGWQSTEIWVSHTHEETGLDMREQVEEDTEIIRRKLKYYDQGDEETHPVNRTLLLSEHGPTHVDAFTHFDPESTMSVDQIPLDRFYTSGIALDMSHLEPDQFITGQEIRAQLEDEGLTVKEDDTVLFHTGHRARNYSLDDVDSRREYLRNHTGLDEGAGNWLRSQGVSNMGIDAPSIENSRALRTKEYPIHDLCAKYEILHMENLEGIDSVVGERFRFVAFPLKIDNGTGSPIRPVAILEE